MITVNIREALRLIEAAYKADIPAFIMGPPGCGKSTVPKLVAKKLGINCLVEDASSLDPIDTRGVMIPDVKTGASRFTRPAIFPRECDGPKGILVIDEVAGSVQATQKSLQPIMLERKSGEHKLPEGWLPVGTGNYAGDNAGAVTLLTSFEDRGIVINMVPDFQIWKEDFAFPMGLDGRGIAYLNWRPDNFCTFDKRVKGSQGKSFATPRSWEKALRMLKVLEEIGASAEEKLAGLAGCLGEGMAVEFMAFLTMHEELPNIKKIYLGKSKEVPKKPDVLYALSGALVAFLKHMPKEISRPLAINALLDYLLLIPAEFAILTFKEAHMAGYKKDLFEAKGCEGFLTKFKEVLL